MIDPTKSPLLGKRPTPSEEPKPLVFASLEDFFADKTSSSSSSRHPPSLKRRTFRLDPKPKTPFQLNAAILRATIQAKKPLLLNGTPYIPLRLLGQGYEGSAYLLQAPGDVKKVLKLKYPDKESEEIFSEVATQLFEYFQLKTKDMPVARHDNFEPFLRNAEFLSLCAIRDPVDRHEALKTFVKKNFQDGYYLVEHIPHPFPEKRDDVPKELGPWEQLKELFQRCLKENIPADLQRQNVALTEDGSLRYFDLRPQPEDLDIPLSAEEYAQYTARIQDALEEEKTREQDKNDFFPLIPQLLRTFTSEGSELWKYLDPRV